MVVETSAGVWWVKNSVDRYQFSYHCEDCFDTEQGTLLKYSQYSVHSSCSRQELVDISSTCWVGIYLLRDPLICRRNLMFSAAPSVPIFDRRRWGGLYLLTSGNSTLRNKLCNLGDGHTQHLRGIFRDRGRSCSMARVRGSDVRNASVRISVAFAVCVRLRIPIITGVHR
jgi:hypothetical protein